MKKLIISIIVIVLLISGSIGFIIYNHIKKKDLINEEKRPLGNYQEVRKDIVFSYSPKWRILNNPNFFFDAVEGAPDSDKGETFNIGFDNNEGTKVLFYNKYQTPPPLTQEEAMRLGEQDHISRIWFSPDLFYDWLDYDASKYVEVATFGDVKILRKSLETARAEGKVDGFTLYMLKDGKLSYQLRILGRDKNTDRINISYVIDPPLDPQNIPPDFEQKLQECDEIVRSMRLKE